MVAALFTGVFHEPVSNEDRRLTPDPQRSGTPDSDAQRRDLSQVLALLQDPVLIGSVGALLWLVLMVAVVCLLRRQGRAGHLLPRPGRGKGASPNELFSFRVTWDLKKKKKKTFTKFVDYLVDVLFAGLHRLASEDLIIKHRYATGNFIMYRKVTMSYVVLLSLNAHTRAFTKNVLLPRQDGCSRLTLDLWRLETPTQPEISGFMGPRSEPPRDQKHQ